MIKLKKIKRGAVSVIKSFRHYKSRFLLMTIMGFISGLFGGIGISVIIPIFSLVTGQEIEGVNFIIRGITKLFALLHIPLSVTFLLIFFVFLFTLKACVQFFAKYFSEKTITEFEEQTRNEIFKMTFESTWLHLMAQKIGSLERLLSNEIGQVAGVLNHVSGIILTGTTFIIYALVAISISLPITLTTILIGAIILVALKPLFYRVRKVHAERASMYHLTGHHVNESIIGAKSIKISAAEAPVIKQAMDYFERLRKSRIASVFYEQLVTAFYEPFVFFIIAILFAISYRSPDFNIAAFVVVIYLIQKMFSFIQSLQGQIYSINNQIPYLQNVNAYRQLALANREEDKGIDSFHFVGSLEFRNVNFSYPQTRQKNVLTNISFSISKGTMVGFIGPSGTGKTTLVDLLLRLLHPQSGEILMDGKNINTIRLHDWRQNISYVPQDNFFLNDTIENNIRFYDESLSPDDIRKAAEMADVSTVIEKMPEQYQTIMGERGLKLSGGQRQRIALARALAKKPNILILDEATSALDNISENLVQNAINKLKGRITVIIIAHRLSTVMNSDKLIVLVDGKILEEGSPADLTANQNSYFSKMLSQVSAASLS